MKFATFLSARRKNRMQKAYQIYHFLAITYMIMPDNRIGYAQFPYQKKC